MISRSVGVSVCPVHCRKMADRIRMPFGIIGRTGPGMRQVVGFGNRSTESCTFCGWGGEFGARHCPQGPTGHTCATAPQRGPLAKLLLADLLLLLLLNSSINHYTAVLIMLPTHCCGRLGQLSLLCFVRSVDVQLLESWFKYLWQFYSIYLIHDDWIWIWFVSGNNSGSQIFTVQGTNSAT